MFTMPWLRKSLSKYTRWLHCFKRKSIWVLNLKLSSKITPISLRQATRWQTRVTRKHAENYSNSTWKQVADKLNDLFEVMQQPSAPSGEWYWRILLENSLFSPPRTCLTPHSGRTPCDINVTYTSLRSAFNGLQFRPDKYWCIFIRLAVILRNTRNVAKFQENLTLQQFKVIQGHRSWC